MARLTAAVAAIASIEPAADAEAAPPEEMADISITVKRSGKGDKVVAVTLPSTATVALLRDRLAAATQLTQTRQRIVISDGDDEKEAGKGKAAGKDAKPQVVLSDGSKTLAQYGVVNGTVLLLKDLGAQIDYRTVFVVEYLGPILIMAAYATRPAIIYGEKAAAAPWNPVAWFAVIAWIAHFVKRELVRGRPARARRLVVAADQHTPTHRRRRPSSCTSSRARPCRCRTCSRTASTTGASRCLWGTLCATPSTRPPGTSSPRRSCSASLSWPWLSW